MSNVKVFISYSHDFDEHRARAISGEAVWKDESGMMNAAAEALWISPEHDLAEAERLINECGYHRRDEELADAKRALLGG